MKSITLDPSGQLIRQRPEIVSYSYDQIYLENSRVIVVDYRQDIPEYIQQNGRELGQFQFSSDSLRICFILMDSDDTVFLANCTGACLNKTEILSRFL